jgi:hypothetical protein
LTNHGDVQLVLLLEPIHDVFERRVVLELEGIPKRPLRIVVLLLGRSNRLRETEEGQSQVDEAILVLFEFLFAVDDLKSVFRTRPLEY